MTDKIKLVLSYKNPLYSEDETFISYAMEIIGSMLNNKLRSKGYLSKEEIYKEFGFDFGKRLNKLYLYDQKAKYLTEMNCDRLDVYVKKGFSEAGIIYLITIELIGSD